MIEDAEYGGFLVTCAKCFQAEEYEEEDLLSLNAAMKSEGWHFAKDDDGTPYHICPNCVEASR